MSTSNDPILLLGAGGMLGRAWRALLDECGLKYTSANHTELDITDSAAVKAFVDDDYDTVINCAAWTDVDGAEIYSTQADHVNGIAVGTLAARCATTKALLVHFSTDYVFDGRGHIPYAIDHVVNPVNAYGRSKLIGERIIQESGCRHLLVRTSWLYAPWGNNFVRTMVQLCADRETLQVVDDQRSRPTSSEHLARTTLNLLKHGQMGTFHITDGGECTWYEFAHHIVRHMNLQCRVEPCKTEEFPRPAKRPRYSVLDLSRTETILSPALHWKDNLASVLVRLIPMASELQV